MTGSSNASLPGDEENGLTILFLCPHGAAKSVIAKALAQRVTAEQNVRVASSNAGTEPDEAVNPIALDALVAIGVEVTEPPRLVSSEDVDRADLVVSMGCAVGDLPAVPKAFIDWSDVPDVSVDVEALISILETRINALISSNVTETATAPFGRRGVE